MCWTSETRSSWARLFIESQWFRSISGSKWGVPMRWDSPVKAGVCASLHWGSCTPRPRRAQWPSCVFMNDDKERQWGQTHIHRLKGLFKLVRVSLLQNIRHFYTVNNRDVNLPEGLFNKDFQLNSWSHRSDSKDSLTAADGAFMWWAAHLWWFMYYGLMDERGAFQIQTRTCSV